MKLSEEEGAQGPLGEAGLIARSTLVLLSSSGAGRKEADAQV